MNAYARMPCQRLFSFSCSYLFFTFYLHARKKVEFVWIQELSMLCYYVYVWWIGCEGTINKTETAYFCNCQETSFVIPFFGITLYCIQYLYTCNFFLDFLLFLWSPTQHFKICEQIYKLIIFQVLYNYIKWEALFTSYFQ